MSTHASDRECHANACALARARRGCRACHGHTMDRPPEAETSMPLAFKYVTIPRSVEFSGVVRARGTPLVAPFPERAFPWVTRACWPAGTLSGFAANPFNPPWHPTPAWPHTYGNWSVSLPKRWCSSNNRGTVSPRGRTGVRSPERRRQHVRSPANHGGRGSKATPEPRGDWIESSRCVRSCARWGRSRCRCGVAGLAAGGGGGGDTYHRSPGRELQRLSGFSPDSCSISC